MRVVAAPELEVMRHGNLHGRRTALPKSENGPAIEDALPGLKTRAADQIGLSARI